MIFERPKNEKHLKKRKGVKNGFAPVRSAEEACSPKSFLESAKSEDRQSPRPGLGHPVPCEQGAADIVGLPPLPPTSNCSLVCLGVGWVLIVILWFCVLCLWGL